MSDIQSNLEIQEKVNDLLQTVHNFPRKIVICTDGSWSTAVDQDNKSLVAWMSTSAELIQKIEAVPRANKNVMIASWQFLELLDHVAQRELPNWRCHTINDHDLEVLSYDRIRERIPHLRVVEVHAPYKIKVFGDAREQEYVTELDISDYTF